LVNGPFLDFFFWRKGMMARQRWRAVAVCMACLLVQAPGCLPSHPPLAAPEGPVALHGLEEVHRPLSVVARLYKRAVNSGKPVTGDFGVREHFLRELEGKWHLVPTLNTVDRLDQLEPGCLVRFKCMVQSHFNPEFYLGQVSSGEGEPLTTKYRDSLQPGVEQLPDVNDLKVARAMWERLPVKCVEIPGETPWAKQQYAELGKVVSVVVCGVVAVQGSGFAVCEHGAAVWCPHERVRVCEAGGEIVRA